MLSLCVMKRHLHLHCKGDHSFEDKHSHNVPVWTITKSNAQLTFASSLVSCASPISMNSDSILKPSLPLHHIGCGIHFHGLLFIVIIPQPLQQQVWPCLGKAQYGQVEASALWKISQPHQVRCSNYRRPKPQRCYILFNSCYLWKTIFSSRGS